MKQAVSRSLEFLGERGEEGRVAAEVGDIKARDVEARVLGANQRDLGRGVGVRSSMAPPFVRVSFTEGLAWSTSPKDVEGEGSRPAKV